MFGRVTVLLVLFAFGLRADVNVMKDITLGFGEALDKCREESQLTEDKMGEFYHFWRDDFKFDNRELGCALLCMSRYYNLLTDSSHIHHENTLKFIRSFPNGAVLDKQMMVIIQDCEHQFVEEPDHCLRMLRSAECFKQRCKQVGIAPTMEVMMAEFIMSAE